jgi:molybdopterin molybdotransferase
MSSKWLSLDAALENAMRATPVVTEIEQVDIHQALDRICANDIIATQNVPPWDNSAMDGFAVNTTCMPSHNTLSIQGTITAGMAASEALQVHSAIKIMTGAPLPEGANAVVMKENTSSNTNGKVLINHVPKDGENIRRKANDIAIGDCLISAGTRLRPEHLMLLSSQGVANVPVFKKVRVGVVATGSELAAPGTQRLPTQIFESNRIGVSAILSQLNVDIVDFGIVKDDEATLRQLFTDASERVDIMVSSGGVSVGDADFVKDIIEELGSITFWKLAIKPGKPFALGNIANTLFCGLPGNPVSAFVTAKLLMLPIVRRMQGEKNITFPLMLNATITCALKRNAGRRDFQRATLQQDATGNLFVTPLAKQSSGVMTSITAANCFMVIHEHTSEIAQGETISVLPFDLHSPIMEYQA